MKSPRMATMLSSTARQSFARESLATWPNWWVVMAAKGLTPASDNLMLLLSLVPYVLDRTEVSVAEAAAHFQRAEADIVRAVELIACAGVPGDSRAYSHLDLFD